MAKTKRSSKKFHQKSAAEIKKQTIILEKISGGEGFEVTREPSTYSNPELMNKKEQTDTIPQGVLQPKENYEQYIDGYADNSNNINDVFEQPTIAASAPDISQLSKDLGNLLNGEQIDKPPNDTEISTEIAKKLNAYAKDLSGPKQHYLSNLAFNIEHGHDIESSHLPSGIKGKWLTKALEKAGVASDMKMLTREPTIHKDAEGNAAATTIHFRYDKESKKWIAHQGGSTIDRSDINNVAITFHKDGTLDLRHDAINDPAHVDALIDLVQTARQAQLDHAEKTSGEDSVVVEKIKHQIAKDEALGFKIVNNDAKVDAHLGFISLGPDGSKVSKQKKAIERANAGREENSGTMLYLNNPAHGKWTGGTAKAMENSKDTMHNLALHSLMNLLFELNPDESSGAEYLQDMFKHYREGTLQEFFNNKTPLNIATEGNLDITANLGLLQNIKDLIELKDQDAKKYSRILTNALNEYNKANENSPPLEGVSPGYIDHAKNAIESMAKTIDLMHERVTVFSSLSTTGKILYGMASLLSGGLFHAAYKANEAGVFGGNNEYVAKSNRLQIALSSALSDMGITSTTSCKSGIDRTGHISALNFAMKQMEQHVSANPEQQQLWHGIKQDLDQKVKQVNYISQKIMLGDQISKQTKDKSKLTTKFKDFYWDYLNNVSRDIAKSSTFADGLKYKGNELAMQYMPKFVKFDKDSRLVDAKNLLNTGPGNLTDEGYTRIFQSQEPSALKKFWSYIIGRSSYRGS